MNYTYLDNGSTSFPKAPGVVKSMTNFLNNIGANVNRGAYDLSYDAENIVYETRELICELVNFNKPENVIFTKNVTESLNVVIKSLFKTGDHVIVSSMEHNAVMRPLNSLNDTIEITKIQCNKFGELDVSEIEKHVKQNTKAIIMTHASNVCGTILDLEKVGEICRSNNIYFVIDIAQTAGVLNIDFQKLNADFLAFTGHKGLHGPQGIGGFVCTDKIANKLDPLIFGGTGSLSDVEIQPDYMPDKFESGTLNIPGIFGLNAALKYLQQTTVKYIYEKEKFLTEIFLDGLLNIDNIKLIGKKTIEGRTSILSVDFFKDDNGIIAHKLVKKYGILTRSGMHCAPSAHKTLLTFPKGTVRFSLSHFTTIDEIKYAINCIHKLAKIKNN